MELICGYSLESNPRATITWTDPHGNTVMNNENYSQDDGPGVVQLRIMRANRREKGLWKCKIEINVCIYSCSDDEKLLKSSQDGQELEAECSKRSFNDTNAINLDVFCKYNNIICYSYTIVGPIHHSAFFTTTQMKFTTTLKRA